MAPLFYLSFASDVIRSLLYSISGSLELNFVLSDVEDKFKMLTFQCFGKGMYSNTIMSIKVYLMAILDNYMFRPLLAIFRLSSRELKVLLYTFESARGAEISIHGPYCVM